MGLLDKLSKIQLRTRLTLGFPTNEIIIRVVPSDLNKIAFISQLLSLTDILTVRYNFVEEHMSFVAHSQETADHIERILFQHSVDFERRNYMAPLHDSAIILSSSPQFQFTNYNNITKLQQEEMDETKTEFLKNCLMIIMDQLSQSSSRADLMLRMRRVGDEELSDIKTRLHGKFESLRKDASYKHMAEADGILVDHRVSTDIVHFASVGTLSLLQNQEEDLLNAQSVYAYELISFAHPDNLADIEGVLKILPNASFERKHCISDQRAYDFIPGRPLYDGTYSVASVNTLSKFLDFEGGKLVHVRESVAFKVPPRQIFMPIPNSNSLDVIIGFVERTNYQAVIRGKNEHYFITGSTGSGKTNAAFVMTEQLIRQGVKVLILEPTKGEWYNLAGLFDMTDHGVVTNSTEIVCLGNPEKNVGLFFNPFAVPDNVSVDSHIQHIDTSFAIAFGESLTEPQYSVLTACTHLLYETYENPCFSDLIDVVHNFYDPKQTGESLGWVKEAIVRKLSRFEHGSINHCFNVFCFIKKTFKSIK